MARQPAADAAPAIPAFLTAIEAEAALLGAILADNRFYDRVADLVAAEDFAEPLHERMFALLAREIGQGRSLGPLAFKAYFDADPAALELGSMEQYLGAIMSAASMIGAVDFAKLIREKSKRRALWIGMQRLMERAANPPPVHDFLDDPSGPSIDELVEQLDAELTRALEKQSTAKSYDIAKAWDRTMAEIEAEAAGESPPGLAVTGFDDWNSLTGNIRRGEVVILAGRPSMGKTALALSTALAAARAGWGTLFVSLEMSVEELMKRAIGDLIFEYGESASFSNVQRGRFTAFDRTRLKDAREQLASWPMIIRQDSGLKVGRLAMMIRRYKRQMAAKGKTLDVVFIDYLGLVRADGNKQKRYEEVSEVSRTIKQIARELDVAIVLLAQLNREVEKREDKRPQLSDLRDSGEIEQDADIVLFVYREQYYLERSEPDPGDKRRADWEIASGQARDKVELIAAKVRNGRIGKRVCHFFAEHQAVRGSDFFSHKHADRSL